MQPGCSLPGADELGHAALSATQRLKYVHSPVFRHAISKGFAIDHHSVIDGERHMPPQRATFIKHVIGESWGNLVHRLQYLCNRSGRHLDHPVLKRRKEPVKMSRHFYRGHGTQPNRTE